MKMSKVGNQTNSQDPQAVKSRVFVGNLNTFQCSKTDIERMFQRYGSLAGISMHKGYAFVQFTNPCDARNACIGEDGATVLSQILDVNLVAEPKPHQTGRKRQNITKTGNDWDYYYGSYCATAFGLLSPKASVPKRARLMPPSPRNEGVANTENVLVHTANELNGHCVTYSNPDILICGNCRKMYANLYDLVEHKKTYCRLRFTCKCDLSTEQTSPEEDVTVEKSSTTLLCIICRDTFHDAWDLIVHAQSAHMIHLYELSDSRKENGVNTEGTASTEGVPSPLEASHADTAIETIECCCRADDAENTCIVEEIGAVAEETPAAMMTSQEISENNAADTSKQPCVVRALISSVSAEHQLSLQKQNASLTNGNLCI